jgi:G2/mitotic-specific cyclin 3/4
MRALRVRDENALPQLLAGKAVHQRNKSTPALSTLNHAGGLKAANTKRTVFADVSNTVRQPIAKDDVQISAKGGKKMDILKDPAIVSAKEIAKPVALLRPAQRPIANLAPKLSASNASDLIASAAQKHLGGEIKAASTNVRKVLSKKATTIFREPIVEAIPEVKNIVQAPAVVEPAPIKVAAPEIATSLVPTNHHVSRRPLETAPTEIKESVCEEKVIKVDIDSRLANAHAEVAQEKYEYLDALEEQARVLEQERNEELAKLTSLDQEEYWDEDEEEEYFDADGYTTARSLRSRGDNTTGGVTLQLAPRITAKSQRELEAAKMFVDSHKSAEDIEDEQWDTSMVAEYGEEIFEYMRQLEVRTIIMLVWNVANSFLQERMKPNASYMDHQAEIQWSMRSVLMDWLVQVHNRFTLLPETLFLAVNYVDRFLSCKVVSLGKLQLVGATALFVAAKYEEINCPSVQEIVYMVDGAYTVDEILKAERFMLSMLHFELGWPGPMSFLRRISKADDYDLETRTLAKYFLEITVMDERFVGCAPSFLAAGAHSLARFMLKKGEWVSHDISVLRFFR